MDRSLSHLSTVLVVAETGSVTQAAELLGRSQPSVSRALRELEYEIGAKVFDRSTRPFTPTAEGIVILRHARSIRGEITSLDEELNTLKLDQKNLIRVGAHAIPAISMLPDAISNLKTHVPDAKIEVVVGRTKRLLEALKEGHFDLVVSTVPTIPHEDLVFETLYEAQLGIFVRKGHPLATRAGLEFRDLVKYPWVYPLVYSHRLAEMEQQFQLNGVQKPDMALSTMSSSLSRHAVLNQDWIILVHSDIFKDDLEVGTIVQLLGHLAMRTVQLAVAKRAGAELSEAAESMINALKSFAQGDFQPTVGVVRQT